MKFCELKLGEYFKANKNVCIRIGGENLAYDTELKTICVIHPDYNVTRLKATFEEIEETPDDPKIKVLNGLERQYLDVVEEHYWKLKELGLFEND